MYHLYTVVYGRTRHDVIRLLTGKYWLWEVKMTHTSVADQACLLQEGVEIYLIVLKHIFAADLLQVLC